MPAGGVAQPVAMPGTAGAVAQPVVAATQPIAGSEAVAPATTANAVVSGMTIEPLLEECVKRHASELHLQVGLPPILRLDGVLHPITTYAALTNEDVQRLVFSTLDEEQQKILIKDKEFDYSFAFGDLGRFRVNAFHEKGIWRRRSG